jgi:hypothetical protein
MVYNWITVIIRHFLLYLWIINLVCRRITTIGPPKKMLLNIVLSQKYMLFWTGKTSCLWARNLTLPFLFYSSSVRNQAHCNYIEKPIHCRRMIPFWRCPPQSLDCGGHRQNDISQRETEIHEKSLPVTLFPSQILHGKWREWTPASTLRTWRINTWVIARAWKNT